MKVGIFNFGSNATQWRPKGDKNALSQGAFIIQQKCKEHNIDVIDLCKKWVNVDVLMVSLFWWEHLYDLIFFLATKGIEYDRIKRKESPIIFAGGGLVSYNPSTARDIVDLICVGDGEDVAPKVIKRLMKKEKLKKLVNIPGVFVSSQDNLTEYQQVDDISSTLKYSFRNVDRRISKEGVRVTRQWERRIEIARGCKRKCLFCGLTWNKTYRENNAREISRHVMRENGCVKAFAPDLMSHSKWDDIMSAYNAVGKYNQARDISTKIILKKGFNKSRSYSTGIDGLSEKIRKALKKPLTNSQLKEIIIKSNAHMGSLGMYMILDLPYESESDVIEWFTTLSQVKLVPSRKLFKSDIRRGFSAERFYILMTLNAFCPTPGTPLQWAGINWRDNLTEKYMSKINILGPKENRRLKHKLLGRAHGSLSRVLESAVLRGSPDLTPFIIMMSNNRRKVKVSRAILLAKQMKLEKQLMWTMEEKQKSEKLPWQSRVKTLFSSESLWLAWQKYKKAMQHDG